MRSRPFVPISWHAFQGLSYFYDGGDHPRSRGYYWWY